MQTPAPDPRPQLLIISDRPYVWVGFRSPDREVRRWVGEREADEERASPKNFAGDPTDPATYHWTRESSELSAVVDLQDPKRSAGAIDALRRTRPEAGVLVITANDELAAPEIAVSRRLAWTDALRVDLEGELRQLEAVRRLNQLREFANAPGDVAILLHPDPDPDALASALALRVLLQRDPVSTPIVTTGAMTRPENRRMAELLRMHVTVITPQELAKLERVVALDFQPEFESERPRLAIIDHHPSTEPNHAEFIDIRPAYGATATMMTEYLLLEQDRRISDTIATALLYGIKTDTDSLARGCIPADVHAYAFLQNHADLPLLRTLERPSYSPDTARKFGEALTHLVLDGELAVVFLGVVDQEEAHVLANIADFCLALESVTWAVAGAVINEELVLGIRHLGSEPGAGDFAQAIAADTGKGGGHATMARAVIPVDESWKEVLAGGVGLATIALGGAVRQRLDALLSNPQSSRPTRQARVPSATHG